MSCCNIVYNTEVLINEAHNNNFHFIVNNIPVSFLLSKFNSKCVNALGPSPEDYSKFNNIDAYTEANNDVRNLALFTQKVNIPGVSVNVNELGLFSTANVKLASPKMNFDPLVTTFKVDENFFIPRFFYYWLVAAANPEELMKYNQKEHLLNFYTDGHLILTDNNRDKTIEIKFEGLHPQSVSPIDLVSDEPGKIFITVNWIYTSFVFSDDYKVLYNKV